MASHIGWVGKLMGKKSGMAKELVDYDFDCLLFCWSSAVCPFQIEY